MKDKMNLQPRIEIGGETKYNVTRNACKLCSPLGAGLAFRGVANAIPLLHGSQGCATYIRRYLISHFKEPIDIASSNFSDETTIYGGAANLKRSLDNLRRQYEPELIGVATTCVSETIGDDVSMHLKEYVRAEKPDSIASGEERMPAIVPVSTPSYSGTHVDGFHAAVLALVKTLSDNSERGEHVNIFPGLVSPADMRYLQEILNDFGLDSVMLPDYSETLDGYIWDEYQKIPEGGTPISRIKKMSGAVASIEFGRIHGGERTAGKYLSERYGVACYNMGLPVGIRESDIFFDYLKNISGRPVPEKYVRERKRLIDSYVDAHKYVFEAQAAIYGEEDFVVALASFLSEIGVIPVLCASGGHSGQFENRVSEVVRDYESLDINVHEDMDFKEIEEHARNIRLDFMIGNSKGYSISRKLNLPLIRVGFPIHDRIGGARLLHLGYRGAQQLFDMIVNRLIERKQDLSPIGYSYI